MDEINLNFNLEGCFTLLNLGAGSYNGPHAGGLRGLMDLIPCKIALDMNEEYLQTWREGPGWVPVWGDIQDLSMFLNKSFDMVFALDVIEHLEKEEGHFLLQEIDRLCKKFAIIWTPEDFIDTEIHQMKEWKEMNLNPYQKHRSGWFREDFERFGYDVFVWDNYHNFPAGTFGAILARKDY